MSEITSPGVYVHESTSSPRSIPQRNSAVTALVGHLPDVGLTDKIPHHVIQGGVRLLDYTLWPDCVLTRAVQGFAQNGGNDLYVLGIGDGVPTVETAHLDLLGDGLEINLVAAPGFVDAASHTALTSHCEGHVNRFAVLDGPKQVADAAVFATEPIARSGKAALYVPWLIVPGAPDATPPSGHVCGIYARVDGARGVWKAPANEAIQGVVSLSQAFSNDDQEALNAMNVNAIRAFPDQGILVWGARTRAPKGHDMRYVPERRMMSLLQDSLSQGIQWAVMEPNTAPTWAQVRASVEAFLMVIWQSGALVGETAEQSFFVRCGSETMTQADLDQGRLLCEVGISMLRPAEFAVFTLEVRMAPRTPKVPSD